MSDKCIFCNHPAGTMKAEYETIIKCPVCGNFKIHEETIDTFPSQKYSKKQKHIIAINVRDTWEKMGCKGYVGPLNFKDFDSFLAQGRPSPIEIMDKVLLNIDKRSRHIADEFPVKSETEFIYHHCINQSELNSVLKLLLEDGLINVRDKSNPQSSLSISTKGYSRLRELKVLNKDSRQCFVAMWFSDEMDSVYKTAIRPAIEYLEEGEKEPKFKAIKIDNVEHINDINDEMIAQIRRSRFMVCDLTGYRGGVYFEAGFAYGLGLDVIYTCRKDWCREDKLQTKNGDLVEELIDSDGRSIKIQKEGIHFDLAHRNRIMWEEDKLNEFRLALENLIKHIIV